MSKTVKIDYQSGCCICGKPLVYVKEASLRRCVVCGKEYESNAACEDGHFVCDHCHSAGFAGLRVFLKESKEKDPDRLFLQAVAQPGVHVHGPEHHCIVPWVLLTVYRNNGGRFADTEVFGEERGGGSDFVAELTYEKSMNEAYKRGSQVPGGICGFWGTCGAAIGAGIYASILLGSAPLNGPVWPVPQKLTSAALLRIADAGGPRCCKRDARIAIEAAVEFTGELTGLRIEQKKEKAACSYSDINEQCRKSGCPYYG